MVAISVVAGCGDDDGGGGGSPDAAPSIDGGGDADGGGLPESYMTFDGVTRELVFTEAFTVRFKGLDPIVLFTGSTSATGDCTELPDCYTLTVSVPSEAVGAFSCQLPEVGVTIEFGGTSFGAFGGGDQADCAFDMTAYGEVGAAAEVTAVQGLLQSFDVKVPITLTDARIRATRSADRFE